VNGVCPSLIFSHSGESWDPERVINIVLGSSLREMAKFEWMAEKICLSSVSL